MYCRVSAALRGGEIRYTHNRVDLLLKWKTHKSREKCEEGGNDQLNGAQGNIIFAWKYTLFPRSPHIYLRNGVKSNITRVYVI